jgi:hypothetical protein
LEVRYPASDQQLVRLAAMWCPAATKQIIEAIWAGLFLLRAELGEGVDLTSAEDNLERQLTLQLTSRIRNSLTGDEPYMVEHQVSEEATRKTPPAQPPTPDIGFIFYEQPRLIWSVEGKVLKSESSVSEYINDLQENFLTCRYSPYSPEAAMLGFLFAGRPANAINEICAMLETPADTVIADRDRGYHRTEHARYSPPGRSFARRFICHHLVFRMSSSENQ